MKILGIDPGKNGGIAFIKTGENFTYKAFKIPENYRDIYAMLEPHKGSICYLEKVHSMPAQGVKSVFSFGKIYGVLIGILVSLNIKIKDVTPQAWQKELNCMSGGDKNVTKNKAIKLFPDIKITHATADSLLIAYYGLLQEKAERDLLNLP